MVSTRFYVDTMASDEVARRRRYGEEVKAQY